MKRLLGVWFVLLLAASPALARKHHQYQVGTVTPYHYTTTTTTVDCSPGANSVDCDSYNTDHDHALYAFTFADGYTALVEHVLWTKDPLKHLQKPTRVKYRLETKHGWGVKVYYIQVLDSRGKEGSYSFVHSSDAPDNRGKKKSDHYGPASVH